MNIVFDLGGVVFSWKPQQLIATVFSDSKIQQRVYKEIYQHDDWFQLDKGTLQLNDAIKRAVKRTGLSNEKISELMDKVPQALVPIPETLKLIEKINNNTEHKLFVLSNMHAASIDYLEKTYSFWNFFAGMVISSRILSAKPEKQIYQTLQKLYDLNFPETVFIDDTVINLIAAEKMGMRTVQFKDALQCENELEQMGFI